MRFQLSFDVTTSHYGVISSKSRHGELIYISVITNDVPQRPLPDDLEVGLAKFGRFMHVFVGEKVAVTNLQVSELEA